MACNVWFLYAYSLVLCSEDYAAIAAMIIICALATFLVLPPKPATRAKSPSVISEGRKAAVGAIPSHGNALVPARAELGDVRDRSTGQTSFAPTQLSHEDRPQITALLEVMDTNAVSHRRRAPRVTIESFPTEILAEVFKHLAFESFDLSSSPFSRRLFGNSYRWTIVLRVCKCWRNVAEENPHLWTFFTTSYRADEIGRLLTASKAANIIVRIDVPESSSMSGDLQEKINLLVTQFVRFSKLQVKVRNPRLHCGELQWAFGNLHAPHLVSLYIDYGLPLALEDAPSPLSSVVLDKGRFPSVETVEFHGYAPPWTSTIFHSLTSLRLTGILAGIPVQQLLQVLDTCPRLEALTLEDSVALEAEESRAITSHTRLPLLRDLCVKMQYHILLPFLRSVRLPDTLRRNIMCWDYAAESMSAFPSPILGSSNYTECSVFFMLSIVSCTLHDYSRSLSGCDKASFISERHPSFISTFDFRGLASSGTWTNVTTASFVPSFSWMDDYTGVADTLSYVHILSAFVNLKVLSFDCRSTANMRQTGHGWLRPHLEGFASAPSAPAEAIVGESEPQSGGGVVCPLLRDLEISVPFGSGGDEERFWKLLLDSLQSRVRRGGKPLNLKTSGFILTADELEAKGYMLSELVQGLKMIATKEY